MCRNLGIFVLNGRIGNVTPNQSVDDIFIASPRILPMVTDLYFDTFIPLLSDKHSPVCLVSNSIRGANNINPVEKDIAVPEKSEKMVNQKPPYKWRNDLAELTESFIAKIVSDLVALY
jgi:hypothetical protein